MVRITGLLVGLLLLVECASTKQQVTAIRCNEDIQGVSRDLSNGREGVIYELDEKENANYLLDHERERVIRWLEFDEDQQTTISGVDSHRML